MQARKHTLAVAIAAVLLPAMALADKPSTTDQGKATAQPVMPTPAVERAPVARQHAAGDAIAAADDQDGNAGASSAGATLDSAAQSNPGKGNWWTDADDDVDGRISRDEARANSGLEPRFGAIDADSDGFVTRDEYMAFYKSTVSQGAEHAADHSAVVATDVWRRLDGNGDGRLSTIEVDADADLRIDFGDMDSNDDGFVSAEEFRLFQRNDDD